LEKRAGPMAVGCEEQLSARSNAGELEGAQISATQIRGAPLLLLLPLVFHLLIMRGVFS